MLRVQVSNNLAKTLQHWSVIIRSLFGNVGCVFLCVVIFVLFFIIALLILPKKGSMKEHLISLGGPASNTGTITLDRWKDANNYTDLTYGTTTGTLTAWGPQSSGPLHKDKGPPRPAPLSPPTKISYLVGREKHRHKDKTRYFGASNTL